MQRWIIMLGLFVGAFLLMYWLIKKVQRSSGDWAKPEGKKAKQKETDIEKMRKNW